MPRHEYEGSYYIEIDCKDTVNPKERNKLLTFFNSENAKYAYFASIRDNSLEISLSVIIYL
jgi:hypothetical protein